MKPKVSRPDAPPADIPPLYVTREDFLTQPSPTPPGRADADKFSILVVLAVVVLAIIAVIAGGVYLYLHDVPPPPPDLKKLSQTHQTNPAIYNPPVEKVTLSQPPILVSAPRVAGPGELVTVAQAAVSDTPAPKESPKPRPRPKPREYAAVPDEPAVATARSPPAQNEPPPPALAEQADPQPEAAAVAESGGSHQANFNLALGVIVETRIYPSKKMKQRALELWASEKKILEPDGSINDKYVLKKSDFSPIPGH